MTNGPGRINYLQITSLCDREVTLRWGTPLVLYIVAEIKPQSQGYVCIGSQGYNEWQTLAFKATTDRKEVSPEAHKRSLVGQRSYSTPRQFFKTPSRKNR